MEATATFKFKTENSAAAIAEMNKLINKDKQLKQQVEKKPKSSGIFDLSKGKGGIGGLIADFASARTGADAASVAITRFAGALRMGGAIGAGVMIGTAMKQSVEATAAEFEGLVKAQRSLIEFNPKGAGEGALESQIKAAGDQAEDTRLKLIGLNGAWIKITNNMPSWLGGKRLDVLSEAYEQSINAQQNAANQLGPMKTNRLRMEAFNIRGDIAGSNAEAAAAERAEFESPLQQQRAGFLLRRGAAAEATRRASEAAEHARKFGTPEDRKRAEAEEILARNNERKVAAESESFETSRLIDETTGKRLNGAQLWRQNRAERKMRRELKRAKDRFSADDGLINVTRGSGGMALWGQDRRTGEWRAPSKAEEEGSAIRGAKEAKNTETLGAINARDGGMKIFQEAVSILKRWDNGK